MSLMSSIFGGEGKDDQGAAATTATSALFASNPSIPQLPPNNKAFPKEKSTKNATDEESKRKSSKKAKKANGAKPDAEQDDGTTRPASDEHSNKDDEIANAENIDGEDDAEDDDERRRDVERRTVFVGNLPPDTTRKALAALFQPCGNVASARLRSLAVTGVKLPPEQAGNQVRVVSLARLESWLGVFGSSVLWSH